MSKGKKMKLVRSAVVISVLGLLAACSGGPQRVPIVSPDGQPVDVIPPAKEPVTPIEVEKPSKPERPVIEPTVRPEHSASQSAVDRLLSKAKRQQQAGNMMAAESSIERAIRIAPSNPQAYARLAQIKEQQGESNSARQWARKALSLQPSEGLRQQLEALLQ